MKTYICSFITTWLRGVQAFGKRQGVRIINGSAAEATSHKKKRDHQRAVDKAGQKLLPFLKGGTGRLPRANKTNCFSN